MTEEQKARWLEMIKENGSLISWMSSEEDWSHVILRRDEAFALCATIAREAKREALEEMRDFFAAGIDGLEGPVRSFEESGDKTEEENLRSIVGWHKDILEEIKHLKSRLALFELKARFP